MKQTFVIALILVIGIVSGCKNNNTLNSKNMSELPKFKYQPNALKLGIIEKKNIDCPVCEKNRDYAYSGGIYAIEEVEFICPWCVADGSAAAKYDGMYIDDASCEEVSDQNKLTELVTKTPNYVSWQQEVWLAHHDDYCSFEKYVGWKEIEHLKENLSDDIERIKSEYGLSQSEFEQYLVNDGGMQGYLFKCLHCDQHRLHIDTN
ncbi:CbrC family protein [uncultured Polaribacter sp.]|uniref:CbrC family protein n=1 Tax=uncultured Polaribacter sp. TaxID=174711 RepID=UPI0026125B5E|nr:CbrC family protein [uncultured Polaribacter sp.]